MNEVKISDIEIIEHFETIGSIIGKYYLRINDGPKELIFHKNASLYKISQIDYFNQKIELTKLSVTEAQAILLALEDLKSEGNDPNQFWFKVIK